MPPPRWSLPGSVQPGRAGASLPECAKVLLTDCAVEADSASTGEVKLEMHAQAFSVRWYVILNPASGRIRDCADHQGLEKSLVASGIEFELHKSLRSRDAEESARRAYLQGWRHFVVAGGDGTAHEVVNGLMAARDSSLEEATIALLPLGTGNDWARSLRIPTRLNAACRVLTTGRPAPIDVGRIDFMQGDQPVTRYFVNVAGAGLDAYVIRRFRHYLSGRLRYFHGLLRSVLTYKSSVMTIHADAWRTSGPTLAAVVSIGKYLGGGMRIAPQASMDDGLFEVTVVRDMSGLNILWHIPRLWFGGLAKSGKARVVQAASVALMGDADIQADGELLGRLPCTMRIIPGAIKLMMRPPHRYTRG